MQNKTKKIISIIILFIIVCVFPVKVFSKEDTNPSWAEGAQSFLDAADSTASVDQTKLKGASDSIYNVLSSVGMVISVVVGMALGIIYMMTSATDKAKVKESLWPYLVGSAIIFGAFGIWKLIINTFSGI